MSTTLRREIISFKMLFAYASVNAPLIKFLSQFKNNAHSHVYMVMHRQTMSLTMRPSACYTMRPIQPHGYWISHSITKLNISLIRTPQGRHFEKAGIVTFWSLFWEGSDRNITIEGTLEAQTNIKCHKKTHKSHTINGKFPLYTAYGCW